MENKNAKSALQDAELQNVSGGVLADPVEKTTQAIRPDIPSYNTTTYVVKRGDTLSAIALQYRTTVSVLQSLNHITNPDVIKEGATLLVPRR